MKKVIFTGNIPYSQIQKTYRDADIFINSSLSEAYGMPILEARAVGLPVVASHVGGIPEIIKHGETGLLVNPGNEVNLSQAIIELLKDKELRENISQKSSQEV